MQTNAARFEKMRKQSFWTQITLKFLVGLTISSALLKRLKALYISKPGAATGKLVGNLRSGRRK